jgi:hypothetical protein
VALVALSPFISLRRRGVGANKGSIQQPTKPVGVIVIHSQGIVVILARPAVVDHDDATTFET